MYGGAETLLEKVNFLWNWKGEYDPAEQREGRRLLQRAALFGVAPFPATETGQVLPGSVSWADWVPQGSN